MAALKYYFIHCSATKEGQWFDHTDIIRFHTQSKEKGGRGWDRVGYRYIILLDGTLVQLRDYDDDGFITAKEITYGAKGYNHCSAHICYIGGLDKNGNPKDTRTPEQIKTMDSFFVGKVIYAQPNVIIKGHNEVANKACPCFDVQEYISDLKQRRKAVADAFVKHIMY